jgi:hypothetical protein
MWRFLGVLLIASSALADRSYVQNLLDSDLTGDELYAVYDKHYDALSQEAKMKEKAKYPKDVYEELLAHRKHGTMLQPPAPPPKKEEAPAPP